MRPPTLLSTATTAGVCQLSCLRHRPTTQPAKTAKSDHHNQPKSHKMLPICSRRLARVLTGLKYFSMPTVRWKEAFPAPATPSLRRTVEVWWIVPRGMYST